MTARRKVVVIGAGFAGMAVVRELRDSDAEVTLLDRNNHHLFQPFLFQVATSILEPAEIATPIRSLVNDMPNVRVEMREAKRIDLSSRVVVMSRRPGRISKLLDTDLPRPRTDATRESERYFELVTAVREALRGVRGADDDDVASLELADPGMEPRA